MKTCDPNDAGVEVNGNAERVMGKREEEEVNQRDDLRDWLSTLRW